MGRARKSNRCNWPNSAPRPFNWRSWRLPMQLLNSKAKHPIRPHRRDKGRFMPNPTRRDAGTDEGPSPDIQRLGVRRRNVSIVKKSIAPTSVPTAAVRCNAATGRESGSSRTSPRISRPKSPNTRSIEIVVRTVRSTSSSWSRTPCPRPAWDTAWSVLPPGSITACYRSKR